MGKGEGREKGKENEGGLRGMVLDERTAGNEVAGRGVDEKQ